MTADTQVLTDERIIQIAHVHGFQFVDDPDKQWEFLPNDLIEFVRAVLSASAGEKKCKTCGGNDGDMPCAYPSKGAPECLRDKRIAASKSNQQDAQEKGKE